MDDRTGGQVAPRAAAGAILGGAHIVARLRGHHALLPVAKTHLAGFSLGGLIAQAFAIEHPGRLDRLAIVSAVANKSPAVLARLKARADKIDAEGRGTVSRSLRTTRCPSASTISALPSMIRRRARRTGTSVSGSKDALRVRQRTLISVPPTKTPPRSGRTGGRR